MQVREMAAEDLLPVMALRVRGWRSAYAGLVPRAYLDAMDPEADARARADWFRRSRATVTDLLAVEEGGAPVGWASVGPCRDGDTEAVSGVSEVYALYAEPDRIGTGVGRLLIEAVHQRVERRTRLWVLAGNARARRFYERAGYRADGAERLDDYGGPVLTEVRYERIAG